jgi:hypothetical protein
MIMLTGESALITPAYVGALVASVEAFGGGLGFVIIGAVYMGASALAAAAELDTARHHGGRLLVEIPTGCRYPFRPPPRGGLPGAAPPLGSGTGFAGQRRS